MSQLSMTDAGDLELSQNKFSIVTGIDEIRQRCIQNLRTFLGEWFLDTTIGVPYFQAILVKNPQENVVDTFLKNEILSTPGVVELLEYDADFDSSIRTLNVTFKVDTDVGELTISEEIP